MIPVILSGGSGTRLWPVSRASYPKQFCEFFDGSFLGNTVDRLKGLGEVYVLTTKSMQALTQRAVSRGELNANNVIFEPMGKNTAPAIALLCHILLQRGLEHEVVGVFPSDHLIANEAVFLNAVRLAESQAQQNFVVTLGVEPQSPATGYGYIEVSKQTLGAEGDLKAFQVLGFREKPNLQTALEYLRSGRHFWNAGMFLFKVEVMVEQFKKLQPELWNKISEVRSDLSNLDYHYALVENISIDYAIMERLKEQACVPCDMGWSDVGSWDEMARLADEHTHLQSRSRAEVFNLDSENNYVFSPQGKVVGLIDVTDVMVVDTPDALLVVKKGSSQKVKELVDSMKQAGLSEATAHPFETRPWGRFEILADEKEYKAKKIIVDPGAQISYQSHNQRSEHWVIVSGKAEVVLNEKTIYLEPGQSVFIEAKTKHRIRNPGSNPLIFVEVQTGEYFGEDDIIRYKDDYNRV